MRGLVVLLGALGVASFFVTGFWAIGQEVSSAGHVFQLPNPMTAIEAAVAGIGTRELGLALGLLVAIAIFAHDRRRQNSN